MVLGLIAQLAGACPCRFHQLQLAMYVDTVDWVSLPTPLGVSQYGNRGSVDTNPYCASRNYINRMSNYCGHCRYDYSRGDGGRPCPFTTLHWAFLDRHHAGFAATYA
jgi:deoxyribodipyrimidine photolyase-related protein